MPLFAAFCGSFYASLSPSFAADTAINVFTETREVPGSAKQVTMIGTPGLVLDGTVATNAERGWFTQDGRTWVVVGDTLYERESSGVYTERGTVEDDGLKVSYASNGKGGEQLAVVSGGKLYVLELDTNTFAEVTLPFTDAVMIVFIDGYGIINQRNTPISWFSGLFDFTSWDGLDFFTRSNTSDNVVGLAVARDRVWVLGSKTSNLFYNSGDVDTPFLPYPGTTVQTGLVSASLVGLYGDAVYWVAESARGDRRVVRATDLPAETISTPPIDLFLSKCSTLSDASMLIYEQEGHAFISVTCPSSPDDVQTYTFDARENLWHARAGWDATLGRYARWRASGSTATDGTVLVGDYENGNLYRLELDAYTDNGTTIRRERTTPYADSENQWFFLDAFELGMQPGVGLNSGQGSAPMVTLEVSRDGAQTWVNAGNATLGAMGAYTARAIWRRLGRFRGDRAVFRVTQTDPVKTVWGPGAWLRASPGTGNL